MLTSLVSSLLESGLPTFHYLVTDYEETNYDRIHELVELAHEVDDAVLVQEIDTTIDRPCMKCSSLRLDFIRFAKWRYRRTKSSSHDLQGSRKELHTSRLFINTWYSWSCRNG